jgi:hypothetical protein
VGVERHRLQVADAVVGRAGGEDVVERERGQRRVAAGAAAPDGEPGRVDVAALDQESGAGDAVVDVVDAPGAVERLAVGAAVAGAAAVVDVQDREPRLVQNCVLNLRTVLVPDVGPPWDITISGGSSPAGPFASGFAGG